ncbi:MAG: LuxR C-terminal-related transcriptional regulator [Vulcanimicrobiaceae bacterium]
MLARTLLAQTELETERDRRSTSRDVDVLRRRVGPALFIVDRSLRVLFYREDPHERRRDCQIRDEDPQLPSPIRRTLEELIRRRATESITDTMMSAAANASIIVRAIWLSGGASPLIAVMVERFQSRNYIRSAANTHNLSPRECEVLQLVVQGAKNSEIAERLFIARSTAIFHVRRLLCKTNSRNRTELLSKVIG